MRRNWIITIVVFIALGLLSVFCSNCADSDEKNSGGIPDNKSGKIYAAKVFQGPQDGQQAQQMFEEMQSLGISHVMMLESVFQEPFVQEALGNTQLKAWMISQIFYNDSFWGDDDHPEIEESDPQWAITDKGEAAWDKEGSDSWLRMACPNNGPAFDTDEPEEGFRQKTNARIAGLVSAYKPYGVSLDFTRYFAFWEKVAMNANPGSLVDTCFCDRCLALFQEQQGVIIPEELTTVPDKAAWIHENHQDRWTAFKTETITSFVAEVVAAIHQVDPAVKINLHAVPWLQAEYDAGIERIVGQNFSALSAYLDWISPMCYTKMLFREPSWNSELVADVATVVDSSEVQIMPAIQISGPIYDEEELTAADFSAYLEEGLKGASAGIAFWPWEAASDDLKEVIRATLVNPDQVALYGAAATGG